MYFKGQDYTCGKRKENLNINIFTDAYSFGGGAFIEVSLCCQDKIIVRSAKGISFKLDFQVAVQGPRSF